MEAAFGEGRAAGSVEVRGGREGAVRPSRFAGSSADIPGSVAETLASSRTTAQPRSAQQSPPLLSAEHRFRERVGALARVLAGAFKAHDLLTYASAISFQILTAIVPFALFALALAGLLDANGVWRDHLEAPIRDNVSPAVFAVIRDAVTKVVANRRVLWATLGGVLALWQISGAIRAVMGALARIYGSPRERPTVRRYTISFILSVEVSACFILAALCLLFAPFVSNPHAGVLWAAFAIGVRWGLVILLLFVVVGLLVRHAPSRPQTVPWVSLGAAIVIALWVIVSLAFYVYLVDIADYDSIFGGLASAIVGMAYLYLSATVFLFGAQLDAIIRTQVTGRAAGVEP
ncbi:MAG: YihY/virulence factor BrkB family protein [Solirubrobacterales bacterium]|nr:YihY/virulence factor BrkB family protein [Solirubrobacterales bacterium]